MLAALEEKAKRAGLELVPHGDLVEARIGKKVIAFHADAGRALNKALERLEEDRLRELDKRPEDREPVLKVRPKQLAAPPKNKHLKNGAVVSMPVEKIIDAAIRQTIAKGSIVKSKYRDQYKKTGHSCGDMIADELRAYVTVLKDGRARVDLVRLRAVADTNDIWRDKYARLNPGQQRMTIGNRLRAKYASGERIDIGGALFDNGVLAKLGV